MASATKHLTGWPETCTSHELGRILGMSDRTVRHWAARGVIVRAEEKGTYRTVDSIRAYAAALRREAEAGPSASSKLAEAKAQSASIVRQLNELKLANIRSDILTIEDLDEAWTLFSRAVNAGLVSLPCRARAVIPHLTEHDEGTLMRIVQGMLMDLAKTSKHMLGSGGDISEFGVLPDK